MGKVEVDEEDEERGVAEEVEGAALGERREENRDVLVTESRTEEDTPLSRFDMTRADEMARNQPVQRDSLQQVLLSCYISSFLRLNSPGNRLQLYSCLCSPTYTA
jgi:hypothetical protein